MPEYPERSRDSRIDSLQRSSVLVIFCIFFSIASRMSDPHYTCSALLYAPKYHGILIFPPFPSPPDGGPHICLLFLRVLHCRHLGIPIGVQSLEDNFFMMQAEKLGLPFTSGMVLYNRISKEGVGFTLIRTFLNRFAAIDGDKDG